MKKVNSFVLLTFVFFGFLYFHFATNLLLTKSDGLYVGHINLYGDLAYHLTLINKFIESGNIIIDNPIFASPKPDYPIFADFVTAQITKLTNINFGLFSTTFFIGMLGIAMARIFIKNFINSEKVIFLSLLIFFFNGGLGFYYFFKDYLYSSQPFFTFLLNMPTEYTELKDKGFWWINNFLAYFIPQRAFLFAFPITLGILSLLYIAVVKNKRTYFITCALLAGLLPIVQVQSLLVVFILCLFYFPQSIFISKKLNKKLLINWLIFAGITATLALISLNSISSVENPQKFIRFHIGWMNQGNLIWFWTKNLGFFAPTLLIAIVWVYKINRKLFNLYLPFLVIFIISNIIVFQPWEFDNSKLFIYWYFASSILVAYFLYMEFFINSKVRKVLAILIVFFIILSASLDIFRTFTPISQYMLFSKDDMAIAESVKILTPKNSLFITAPVHNHPITALAGRSTLLGFYGWVWSHGIDYSQRAGDIASIYNGVRAEELISKYKINYVTIGPLEKQNFTINNDYFNQFPKISLNSQWDIYDVSNIWTNSNR